MLRLPSGVSQTSAHDMCCGWTHPNDECQLLDVDLLSVDEVGEGIAFGGRVLSPDANVEGGSHIKTVSRGGDVVGPRARMTICGW